ncbi:amidohydrolase [Tissierella sp. Yu-01]|uniref:amidohydrolase n=1 Tax=Tissierella sp. Yu-01 TaxID=3035694 RepID=UPI00240E6A9D|nr:amidohydrolase [Tissierella sp. Yu-01]WFA10061.1 amidohydrolase [Tissierella sp. Yu-01]
MNKKELLQVIDDKKELFIEVSDKIWEYAELSLLEFKSAKLYIEKLKELGFEVEEEIAGVKTAFTGTYGSGKPIIGILAEFDALSGLSQESEILVRKELVKGGCGHGCGHHLLGAGSLAAAVAIKEYLTSKGEGSGTVVFYGCPGEEGGAGKAFMAREGIFYDLDAALTWHPGSSNEVTTGTNNSSIQIEYTFEGIASHAAGAPHMGRSALDGVELMNIGVQFLREHIKDYERIHYSIIDAGGNSPNVVQPRAQVLYMVRSNTVLETKKLLERVDNIAKAAAMMSETTLSRRFIDGTSNTIANSTLEKLLYKNFEGIELPEYTDEEWTFANELKKTYPSDGLPGFGAKHNFEIANIVSEKTNNGERALNDFLMPQFHSSEQSMGSTDVGDVSWQTPTAQINTVTWTSGSPGHSWQNVSLGKSNIAHKGLLLAGKVLASTAMDLYENPDILIKAKEEWKLKTVSGYICPIEVDAIPIAIGQ